MTGLIIAGVVALVGIYVALVLMGYRKRLAHGPGYNRGDDTMKLRGNWYNTRGPVKQSVVTDTHGDLVHQDGSTTPPERQANVSRGKDELLV